MSCSSWSSASAFSSHPSADPSASPSEKCGARTCCPSLFTHFFVRGAAARRTPQSRKISISRPAASRARSPASITSSRGALTPPAPVVKSQSGKTTACPWTNSGIACPSKLSAAAFAAIALTLRCAWRNGSLIECTVPSRAVDVHAPVRPSNAIRPPFTSSTSIPRSGCSTRKSASPSQTPSREPSGLSNEYQLLRW